jgi:hypothetical protein
MSSPSLHGWMLEDHSLDLKIVSKDHLKGKVYSIPEPDIDTTLWATDLASKGERIYNGKEDEVELDDVETDHLYERLIGVDVLAELRGDGIKLGVLKHVAATVMVWIVQDRAEAEKLWESGPKATAPANRADRRAATSTRKPASVSSTTKTPAKRAPRGRKS